MEVDMIMFDLTPLNKNVMFLKFTKKDGSIREMYATKDLNRIPFTKHPKPVEQSEQQESKTTAVNVTRVFDVEIKEWRSVLHDNIIEAEIQ